MAGSEGQGRAASAATESLPNERPWTGKPLGRSREPIGWIIVLAEPVFLIAGMAAVEAAGGLTMQNVDSEHDKKAGGNLPRLKSGSPCATLFITVLVLRLLTENRCDSISYQRACGPRQGGNFDNPIFPLTLPKRGAASRVVNLSRVVSQTCRNDQPRSTCRLVTQFDTHFIRYYPIATWPSGVLILNHPAPDGQWRLRRPNPPQCRTCPFDPELSAQARAGKRGSFLGRNRRFRTGTVSLTDSTGR